MIVRTIARRRLMSTAMPISFMLAFLVTSSAFWTSIACSAEPAVTADSDSATTPAVIEVIRERNADGKVVVEREVTIDADGNYVNHGAWRMWNATGELVAEGYFEMGRRQGPWIRRLGRDEAALLSQHPFDKFEAPFTSQAKFVDGQLDGEWFIIDAQYRKCSSVELSRGKRNGAATLWLPNGDIDRQATFHNGVTTGDVRKIDADGHAVTIATYLDGHQLVSKTTHFPGTERRQSEGSYLTAAVSEASPDDFWQLQFAEYVSQEESVRHGRWKSWYENGQLELSGTFQFDRENGKFTWWHANGQTAVEGEFVDGLEDGAWVWWHANGQKATVGHYQYGKLTGAWRGWSDDGRLVQQDEYRDGQVVPVAAEPPVLGLEAQPALLTR